MSKYVFKNPEVEKALRFITREIGYSDEEFNSQIQRWGNDTTVRFISHDRHFFQFPSYFLKEIDDFNPNGWNEADVIPPEDEDDRGTSKIMLIESEDHFPYKGYFNFDLNCWCELGSYQEIECLRYRPYPFD